ncbi:Chloroperoxidase [Coprinopsis sp. MPI-PUGE-AT-0042]|nr:Chloroperoxidase [Coprinopsis sp. MPI-PUGE-AT-0042]
MVSAFPSYQPLEARQVERPTPRNAGVAPGPLNFSGTKLVNDADHPFIAPGPGDLRGPCPALNTLANHGYLPRDGVASPAQIITAIQEGFNMENSVARFNTYVNHLLDGNVLTDLISIGDKTPKTGSDEPPPPALVSGMNHHGTFEGDASLTRADAFFGDNHSFNPEIFEQFKSYSSQYGGGFYTLTAAAEYLGNRFDQSKRTNPDFNFVGLRHITAFDQATYPFLFFVDGRRTSPDEKFRLDMVTAERFFEDMQFPDDFHRASEPLKGKGNELADRKPGIAPGRNQGRVDSFVMDASMGNAGSFGVCRWYERFVNVTIRGLYPNATGLLKSNLEVNLQYVYQSLPLSGGVTCPQIFL